MPARLVKRAAGIITGPGVGHWDAMVDFLGYGRNRYPTTYTVFMDTGVAYAQNGETGNLDYSDADHDAVLQYAIDAIETAGDGGKIFVRGGSYAFNTSIDIMENDLTIEFESSVDIAVTGAINGFNIGDATHPVYRTHLIGNGCVIDHNGAGGGIAFSFYDAHDGTIQGFHLSNWEGAGIQWNRSWYNDMFLNQIDTGGTCVIINGVPGARTNHLRIRHNSFGPGAGETCLEIVNYGRNILIDHNIFGVSANGIVDHSSMNTKITNNWFEFVTATHIHIQGDTDTVLHPKIQGNTHITDPAGVAILLDDVEEPVVGGEKVDGGGVGGSFVTTTANTVNLTVESSWHPVAPYTLNAATTGGAIMEPGSAAGVQMGGGARIVFGDKNAAAVAGDFFFDPTAGDGMEGFVYDRANERFYWYADGGVHFINEAGVNRAGYTYTVFIDGANAYAQNNDTGVLDFNSADHDATIQYCIDQIELGGAGGSVLVKRGAYACNSTIDIMENDFKMEFEAGTVLTFTGAIDGFNIGDATHQVLRCSLIGNGAWIEHAASAGLIAFSFYDTHFSKLVHFNIGDTADWGATGVKWDRSWTNEMTLNRIVNCTTCIEIDGIGGARTNDLNINKNYMGGGTTGILITNYGRDLKIEQNVIATLTNGIHDHSSFNLHVMKNFFEDISTNDIYIQGDTDTCLHPKIMGNTHILSGACVAVYLDDCEEPVVGHEEVSGGGGGGFVTTTANTVNLTVESSYHPVAPYSINAATNGGAIMEPGSAAGGQMGGGARIIFGDKNGAGVAGDFFFDPTAGNGFEGFLYDYNNGRLYWYGNGNVHYVTQTAGIEFGEDHKNCALSGVPFQLGDIVMMQIDRFAEDGSPHATPVLLSEALEKLGYKK